MQVREGVTGESAKLSGFLEITLQGWFFVGWGGGGGGASLSPSPTLKCEHWSRHFRNKPQQALQC